MLKHLLVLISSVFWTCGAADALADSPFDVTPIRYPFLPSLIEINEPSVCSPFLTAVTEAYKGPDFDIKSVGHTLPGVGARWLLSAEDIAAQFEGTIDHPQLHDITPLEQIRLTWDYVTATEVDFAGDGSTNILTILGSEDPALRRHYMIALFENKAALDGAVAGATSVTEILKHAVTSWRLDRPSILEVAGNFYAVTNPQSSHTKDVHEELWRLTSSGTQLACRIQLTPPHDPQHSKSRLAGTAIEELDRILDMVAGQESYCGGTLRFVDQSVIYADQVMKRANRDHGHCARSTHTTIRLRSTPRCIVGANGASGTTGCCVSSAK